jgi:hypothetical protein
MLHILRFKFPQPASLLPHPYAVPCKISEADFSAWQQPIKPLNGTYEEDFGKSVKSALEIDMCRQLLGSGSAAEPESSEETTETRESPSSVTPTRVCPVCGAGRMIVIKELPPMPAEPEAHGAGRCIGFDSS